MGRTNDQFELGGINHLALVCSDMERTVDFYTNVLGMPLIKTIELPMGMGQHFFFDIGNGDCLAFFWFPNAPAAVPGVASPPALPGGGRPGHRRRLDEPRRLRRAGRAHRGVPRQARRPGHRVHDDPQPRRQRVPGLADDARRRVRAQRLLLRPGRRSCSSSPRWTKTFTEADIQVRPARSLARQALTRPRGVHHLAISTGDIKAQIEFCSDVLGMELVALYWMHGVDGAWHAFMKLGDTCSLAFVQMDGIADDPRRARRHPRRQRRRPQRRRHDAARRLRRRRPRRAAGDPRPHPLAGRQRDGPDPPRHVLVDLLRRSGGADAGGRHVRRADRRRPLDRPRGRRPGRHLAPTSWPATAPRSRSSRPRSPSPSRRSTRPSRTWPTRPRSTSG